MQEIIGVTVELISLSSGPRSDSREDFPDADWFCLGGKFLERRWNRTRPLSFPMFTVRSPREAKRKVPSHFSHLTTERKWGFCFSFCVDSFMFKLLMLYGHRLFRFRHVYWWVSPKIVMSIVTTDTFWWSLCEKGFNCYTWNIGEDRVQGRQWDRQWGFLFPSALQWLYFYFYRVKIRDEWVIH